MKIKYFSYKSAVGEIFFASTERGICTVDLTSEEKFVERLKERFRVNEPVKDPEYFESLAEELDRYFSGERMNVPKLDIVDGTELQRKVWKALLGIPHGKTVTYKKVAETVGKPKAFRAVGRIIGENPIPILIPCHRVLRSDGCLAGYASGLDIKKKLLRLEKAI